MTTTTEADLLSWTRERSTVLHVPTGAVGEANRYYDGSVEVFIDANGRPVPKPVLAIGEQTFLASDPTCFERLSDDAALVYVSFAEQLGELLKVTVIGARTRHVSADQAFTLITSVLHEQIRRLNPASKPL